MSKLKAKAPVIIKKRLKAFFYGGAGTGKTYCAIQFPKPYFIDTERGGENSKYVKLLTENGGAVYQTRDFKDLYEQVMALANESHPFQTIVIDPITPIYENLVLMHEQSIREKSHKSSSGYSRHYIEANKDFKKLADLLLRIDMNVIVTAHAKKEYCISGNEMQVTGETFDAYKKLDHLFDLIVATKLVDKKFMGYVIKSRIESIPTNSEINFSYKSLNELYEKDFIQEKAKPLTFLKEDIVKELNNLIEKTGTSESWVNKCLSKNGIGSLEELSEEAAHKMIDHLLKALDNANSNVVAIAR